MAEIEEVGVAAVVKGFPAFVLQLEAMSAAIASTGVASAASAVGIAAFTLALVAVVAVVVAVVAGIGLIVAGFAALTLASINVGRKVESAFAGVAKTTNGLTDEFGRMNEAGKAVRDQFIELSKEVPLAIVELLKIGEFAGQLGIAKENLVDFTEVVAALGVSTELSTEEAAIGLARLAGIYEVSTVDMIENTERLGSTITFLGNNFKTNEPLILSFAKRIAGIAAFVDIGQASILGFGAAFTSAGVEAQLGGTALQNTILAMSKAVSEGGEELETFAQVSGKSADEFIEAWGEDAAGAVVDFIEGLGDMGDEAFRVLEDVGLASDRTERALLPLAAAGDLLRSSIEGANQAWEENTALTREATIFYETFDSKLQILKNTFDAIGVAISDVFKENLKDSLGVITSLVEAIGAGLVPAFQSIFDALTGDLLPAFGRLLDALGFDVTGADLTQGIANFGETIAGGIEAFADFVDEVAELVDLFEEGGIESLLEHFGIDPDDAETFLAIAAGITAFALALWLLPPVLAAISGFSLATLFAPLLALGGLLAAIGLPILALAAAIGILVAVIIKFGARAKENFEKLKAQVIEIWEALPAFLEGVFNDMKERVTTKFAEIKEAIATKLNEILESFGITEEIKERWRQIWEDVKLITSTVWLAIQKFLITTWEKIVKGVSDIFAPIGETLAGVWESIKESLISAWGKMIKALNKKGAEIGVAIGTFIANWIQTMRNSARLWIGIGKTIMDSLLKGLKRKVGQIVRFITSLAERVLKAIKAALGIGSPSKQFFEVGENLMESLAQGISKNTNLPQVALDATATRMISAGGQIANAGIANNNIDRSFNPTVNANFATPESPADISTTLALMAMLEGAS